MLATNFIPLLTMILDRPLFQGFVKISKSIVTHNLPSVILPVVWYEYCAEYLLKELQESMNRCTDRSDKTEILLETALNTIQSISL